MGMRITISVRSDDADKIKDIVRTIIRERTGKDPIIHVLQTPQMLDNIQREAYNKSIQQLGAP